jgi:hypothetical protein
MERFSYRSLDELREDISARRFGIDARDRLAPIGDPVRIGGRTAGNRLGRSHRGAAPSTRQPPAAADLGGDGTGAGAAAR